MFLTGVYSCVSASCVRVYMLMPTCVYAGVRAYPPVCVCTLLGSARELTGAEKTPIAVAEETDIDAEDVTQVATPAAAAAAEELSINRGVTDLDATAKTSDVNHTDNKVKHTVNVSACGETDDNKCLDQLVSNFLLHQGLETDIN